ncbi:hypothetical protein SDC9_26017 [bioreactor metagenome]|uniref:Uncharacterized protein n=1 Tax=bioreactor metagenome TaxID=1076179 RepID=A0A644UME0_9ZZZZ
MAASGRGMERPAEGGRRGLHPAAVDGGQDDQHDDGQHIGRHRQQVHRDRIARGLQLQLQRGDAAEEIGADQHPPGTPGGEDDDGERDPAGAGGHPLGPLRHAHEAEIGAAHPGERAAEGERHQPHRDNPVAKRMRRLGILAHGAQDQPGAGEPEKGPDRDDEGKRQIDHPVMREQDAAKPRDLAQRAEGHLAGGGRPHPLEALAEERRQAEPEEREGKAGRGLVRQEHLGQHGKERGEQRAGKGTAQKAQHRAAGADGRGKARDGADDHHPLDAEVQHARLLGDELARCRQQHRGRGRHQRGDQRDDVDAAEDHARALPMRTR